MRDASMKGVRTGKPPDTTGTAAHIQAGSATALGSSSHNNRGVVTARPSGGQRINQP
jgi:hypothetical protein